MSKKDWQHRLNDCGCCEGIARATPEKVDNRQGLDAISYRIGSHASFKESMLALLSSYSLYDADENSTSNDQTPLAQLRTRDDGDFSIALLDAWAIVADVLTFYQERIANESWLRTATERLSVQELARLIGYKPHPGVAASVQLAFMLEHPPQTGAAVHSLSNMQPDVQAVRIEKGIKVQSIPGQDEKAQTFETVEEIEGRVEWNELKLRQSKVKPPGFGDTTVYLKGMDTRLKQGDALLFIGDERKYDPGSERWDFRRVQDINVENTEDPAQSFTIVTLDEGLGSVIPHIQPAAKNPKIYALRERASLFGHNAPDWRALHKSVKGSYLGLKEEDPLIENYQEWPGLAITDISEPPTNIPSEKGVYGEYYEGINFDKRIATRLDKNIYFEWQEGKPHPSIASDKFAVRWTGWLVPEKSGEYTLVVSADDGVRLWVDNKVMIDEWKDQSETTYEKEKYLQAGKKYRIKVEYYEHEGLAVIKLQWKLPNSTNTVHIPTNSLYPANTLNTIYLDKTYQKISSGSWVVLSIPEYKEVYEVEALEEATQSSFTLSSKITRLKLKGENLREQFNDKIRETAVYAQSEELDLAETPLPIHCYGDTLELDKVVDGLVPGQTLAISGARLRIRLTETATGLTLTDKNENKIADLETGDVLQVLAPPELSINNAFKIELPPLWLDNLLTSWQSAIVWLLSNIFLFRLPLSMELKWQLRDRSGREGKMTLPIITFPFLPSPGPMVELAPATKEQKYLYEIVQINSNPQAASSDRDCSTIKLSKSLKNVYDRTTVTINANVASATHGELTLEILGSGNATQTYQRFTLKQHPLTYVYAATTSGAESTLKIYVNDQLWQEVPYFYGYGPNAHIYVTKINDKGELVVQFGDGKNGACLPTGQDNVRAEYRRGIGVEGMVRKAQLSQLMSRPLGLKGVINPIAAEGAQDPESRDEARKNAPMTVLTMDRIVSVRDYEDFARAFAGVAKAKASLVWDGRERIFQITVAGNGGKPLNEAGETISNLNDALRKAGDPFVRFRIKNYQNKYFRFAGTITIAANFIAEKVKQNVEATLRQTYSFEQRHFDQPVLLSELLTVIHSVPGIIAVDVDKLYCDGKDKVRNIRLIANDAMQDEAAELLTLHPDPLDKLDVAIVQESALAGAGLKKSPFYSSSNLGSN